MQTVERCSWCLKGGELYHHYHDTEWGVPSHDDVHIFEHLILEGAQAGLSWLTILRRRETYRKAYEGFIPEIVADFTPAQVEMLMQDAGIIRNRAKIVSSINNARRFRELQERHGNGAAYFWNFVDGKQVVNQFSHLSEMPAETDLSRLISKDMKRLGFSFCGPVGIYAFMQSIGMVNDHLVSCFRHREVAETKQFTH